MKYDAIIQFNNVNKPYFLIKVFCNNTLINAGCVTIENTKIENGICLDEETINKLKYFLEANEIKRDNVLFLLNVEETFKLITSLPNVNDRRARKMYESEFTNKVKSPEMFNRTTSSLSTNKTRLFFEFMTNKRFEEYCKELSAKLEFGSFEVDYYYNYLFNHCNRKYKDNYLYLYEERGIVSLLLVIQGQVISYTSFKNQEASYNLALSSYVDKYIKGIETPKIVCSERITYLDNFNPIKENYFIGKTNEE